MKTQLLLQHDTRLLAGHALVLRGVGAALGGRPRARGQAAQLRLAALDHRRHLVRVRNRVRVRVRVGVGVRVRGRGRGRGRVRVRGRVRLAGVKAGARVGLGSG